MIAAKTTEPHPKLPGTIYTAAKEGTLWELVLLDFCVVWQRWYFDPVTRRRMGGACANPYSFQGCFKRPWLTDGETQTSDGVFILKYFATCLLINGNR